MLGAAIDRAHAALAELLDDRVAAVELAPDQRIGYLELDEARAVVGAALAAANVFSHVGQYRPADAALSSPIVIRFHYRSIEASETRKPLADR